MTDALVEAKVAALMALAEHGPTTDIQEVLVAGDGRGAIAPGAIDKMLAAALQAIEAAGYRVVPVEATREMRVAGEQEMMARHTNLDCFRDPYVDSTYAAMLSAAPRVGEGV